MVTVLAAEHPTARKVHQCDWCGTSIKPGEKYLRQRNIGDDGPYVWKSCAACEDLVNTVLEWVWYADEGVGRDDFAEWASEHPDEPGAVAYRERAAAARQAFEAALSDTEGSD